jgi:hypothetical protein
MYIHIVSPYVCGGDIFSMFYRYIVWTRTLSTILSSFFYLNLSAHSSLSPSYLYHCHSKLILPPTHVGTMRREEAGTEKLRDDIRI